MVSANSAPRKRDEDKKDKFYLHIASLGVPMGLRPPLIKVLSAEGNISLTSEFEDSRCDNVMSQNCENHNGQFPCAEILGKSAFSS